MELLRSLKKEQILEVLSDAFCPHCEDRLLARITRLRERKMYETFHPHNDIVSSRDASHMQRNGRASEFYTRRHGKQEDRPRDYFQRREAASLMKRNRHGTDSSPRYSQSKRQNLMPSDFGLFNVEMGGDSPSENELFEEEKEFIRYSQVGRKQNFVQIRRLQKQQDSPRNSRHESTLLMKHNRHATDSSPRYLNNKRQSLVNSDFLNGEISEDWQFERDLSEEQMECFRYSSQVGRRNDFVHNRRLEAQNYFQRHKTTWSNNHNRRDTDSSPRFFNSKRQSLVPSDFEMLLNDGIGGESPLESGLSKQKKHIRCSLVQRKKNFVHIEKVEGRNINVLQGLELHTGVFNVEEQKNIVNYVYKLQRMGKNGQLRGRTYSEPRKWMRGKGRVTIQFGCCYNYAKDKYGNSPGIMRDEEVDPLPQLFKQMIKRMVEWHILPPTCIPNSCIVNIYDEGDCIPPHIDHHDFVRPFSTVSLLSECDIVFGSNLKVISPGEFLGPVPITLPVGSVFLLNGNGADIAKHCVPSVPTKRISITFRKMDDRKLPFKFSPDPELVGIKPLT